MISGPGRFVGLLAVLLLVAGCKSPTSNPKSVTTVVPPVLPTTQSVRGPYTDEKTGLVFPTDISRWLINERRAYEPKALGVSYSYKSKLQRLGAVTCYVYDRGMSNIPTGGASDVVQREIAETVMAVVVGAQQRGAVATELMPISALRDGKGNVLALIAAHRLLDQGVTNISISAMTGYQGQFVKLRFTFPGNDLDDAMTGLGGLGEFVNEMRELNKATLDPFFLTGGSLQTKTNR